MSDSIELITVKECTPQLETALRGIDTEVVHFLYHEGFITDNVRDKVLNPASCLSEADKASELVKWIRNRVQQDRESYHIFLRRLKESGKLYQPIAGKMEAEYERKRKASTVQGE